MAGNIIAGFAPAAGTGKAVTGFAPAGEQAADPLGVFGALLEQMTSGGPDAGEFVPMSLEQLEAIANGPAKPPAPLGVEFGLEAPARPKVDGEALLADLADALAELDQALAEGEPVDRELADRLADAMDALAGLLGIALPTPPAQAPAADPATVLPAVAAPDTATPPPPAGELDALLALAGAGAPLPQSGSTLAPAPAGGEGDVVFTVPAVPASATEVAPAPAAGLAPPAVADAPPAAAGPASGTSAPPAAATAEPGQSPSAPASTTAVEARPAIDPRSELGQLAKKITELAQALEPQSPGLAKRLDALAQQLGSGEISATTLAELGLDDAPSLSDDAVDQALARLLAANSEVKGAPAPQAFAAAQLKLPEVMAPAPASPAPDSNSPVAPEAPIEAAPEPQVEAARDADAAHATDRVRPQPAARNLPDDAKAATSASAEPASPTQPAGHAAVATTAVVAGTKAAHAAYQAPVHQINIPQVAFEVLRHIQAGNSRFQIRLDPPELGRIDVKLDVDQSGNVNARMTVERAETLDLMQRDQRSLERALAQAGLDGSKTSLEFSLRQNPFGRDGGGDGRPKGSPFGGGTGESAGAGDEIPDQIQTLYRGSTSASGVNLFV